MESSHAALPLDNTGDDSASPPFRLLEVQLEDLPELARIAGVAFGRDEHPAISSMFPKFWSREGMQIRAHRWRLSFEKQPGNVTWLMIVNEATGTIAGHGQWLVPCEEGEVDAVTALQGLSGQYWESEDDREFAEWLRNEYVGLRNAAIRETKGQVFCELASTTAIPRSCSY
jgi:hypothetical protein